MPHKAISLDKTLPLARNKVKKILAKYDFNKDHIIIKSSYYQYTKDGHLKSIYNDYKTLTRAEKTVQKLLYLVNSSSSSNESTNERGTKHHAFHQQVPQDAASSESTRLRRGTNCCTYHQEAPQDAAESESFNNIHAQSNNNGNSSSITHKNQTQQSHNNTHVQSNNSANHSSSCNNQIRNTSKNRSLS